MNRYFITGIGTEVGKTLAAAILTEALHADYWKLVQAGDLEHGDTQKVRELISNKNTHFHPPAWSLRHAMSPHAAASLEGLSLDPCQIRRPDVKGDLVIEGAGGLLVPLNEQDNVIDLIAPDDKVILVSRHYLGSINHTLLSLEVLKERNLHCSGIIFSGDPMPGTEEIILKRTETPVIGRIREEVSFDRSLILNYARDFRSRLKEMGLINKRQSE